MPGSHQCPRGTAGRAVCCRASSLVRRARSQGVPTPTGHFPGPAGIAGGSNGPGVLTAGTGRRCHHHDARRRRPASVGPCTGTGPSPSAVPVGGSHSRGRPGGTRRRSEGGGRRGRGRRSRRQARHGYITQATNPALHPAAARYEASSTMALCPDLLFQGCDGHLGRDFHRDTTGWRGILHHDSQATTETNESWAEARITCQHSVDHTPSLPSLSLPFFFLNKKVLLS